jgi:glycosyltransferase involved in cell wall biosynthesis
MKILLITYNTSRRGGIERLSLDVAKALQGLGYELLLLSTKRLGPGLLGRLFGQLWFLFRVLVLSRQCNQLFSMHSLLLSQVELLLPRNLPRLCWLHGVEVWGAALPPVAPALRRCKRLIASSKFTSAQLHAAGGPWPEIAVLNPLTRLWENFEEPTSFPSDFVGGLRLLTVARMAANEQYKGHEIILHALALFKEICSNAQWCWQIVGDGNDRGRLEVLTTELGLAENVEFLGDLDDESLRSAYLNCNLFVMPSSYSIAADGGASGEGFGIAYLEAALAGRAAIGCRQGGQTDVIMDGETGWLVNPQAEELVQVFNYLIANPAELRRCGEAARSFACKYFSEAEFNSALASFLII